MHNPASEELDKTVHSHMGASLCSYASHTGCYLHRDAHCLAQSPTAARSSLPGIDLCARHAWLQPAAVFWCSACPALQELDLPDDMALDDAAPQDGDSEPAADEQAADLVDEGPASKEPSKQDPEQPAGDEEPDSTAAGDTEEAETEAEAAPEAAAEGDHAGDQHEASADPNPEQGQPEVQEQGEEGPEGEAPLGGQDPEGEGRQEHQAAAAGPRGTPAAAPLGAGEQGSDAAAQVGSSVCAGMSVAGPRAHCATGDRLARQRQTFTAGHRFWTELVVTRVYLFKFAKSNLMLSCLFERTEE